MNEPAQPRRFVVLLVAVLLALAVVDTLQVLRITNNHDFAVYYTAAQRLRAGEDIYADLAPFRAFVESGQSTKSEDTPWPFVYPPFQALLALPLTFLGFSWASVLWTAICLAAIAAAMSLLVASQRWWTLGGLATALLLLYQYQPAVVGLRLGQIDIVIFLLFVMAFYWLQSRQEEKAGLALGVAMGIKVFAIFLILFLLWKRRWRAALWGLISGLLFLVGSFALVGMDGLRRYLDFSSLYTWGAFAGYPYHQSFNAFLSRTFKPNIFMTPYANLPWLADALTIMLSLATLLAFLWLTRYKAREALACFDLEYALALTTMLLIVPPAPRYSFIWLLASFIIVAARLVRGQGPTWLAGLVAVAYVLCARLIYLPVPLLRRLVMDGQFMLGAVFLWLAIAWLLWQQDRQQQTSA